MSTLKTVCFVAYLTFPLQPFMLFSFGLWDNRLMVEEGEDGPYNYHILSAGTEDDHEKTR